MLSDILSSLCRIQSKILEEDGYLLARAEIKGAVYIAEAASRAEDLRPARVWPTVGGVLRPVSERREPSGVRLAFFKDPGGECLLERIARKPLTETQALELGAALAGLMRGLHSRGFVLGYIGPESVFIQADGSPVLLGGLRGIPQNPFSSPEAASATPVDPRSDIFALGTLLFRMVAGSDDKDVQLKAWSSLTPSFRVLVERMVAERLEDRYPNLTALMQDMKGAAAPAPPVRGGQARQREFEETGGIPARVGPRGGRRLGTWLPIAVIGAIGLAAAAFVLFSPDNSGRAGRDAAPPDTVSPPPPDSIAEPDTAVIVQQDPQFATPAQTTVWVSNCSGVSGAASTFRTGAARDFAQVYPSTGTGTRDVSVLLLRRSDITLPLDRQFHWQAARILASADSALEVRPVDVTILLGADLSYPGTNGGVFTAPSAPVETLYVDVVNQGLQYSLEGVGPATWVTGIIDGRSVSIGGEEYFVEVIDYRDGDRIPNEEIAIPGLLDTTVFIYRSDSGVLPEFEGRLRSVLQALPDEVSGPPDGVPVPDLWVVLGRAEGST